MPSHTGAASTIVGSAIVIVVTGFVAAVVQADPPLVDESSDEPHAERTSANPQAETDARQAGSLMVLNFISFLPSTPRATACCQVTSRGGC